ncbi:MAG: hypothetical protein LBN71_03195 [Tannerella sp.]|jgi:hypothetical protein|nr:hypothetical protein [Tannerella sp.]
MKGKNSEIKGLNSQGAGLLPILLLMFLNKFYSYQVSFEIATFFCVGCVILFGVILKARFFQFMLLPASLTLMLYFIFFLLRLDSFLSVYSPLVIEWLLVGVLAFCGFSRHFIIMRVRKLPFGRRSLLLTPLAKFFNIVQIVRILYTLHLFVLLFYIIIPYHNDIIESILYQDTAWIIGVLVIVLEQIYIVFMKQNLRKEQWLPVLQDKKVIGRIAYSVSLMSKEKYCHPVVRIAVVYSGMLYLLKRKVKEFVSSEMLDYPFYGYVLFKHTLEQTVQEITGPIALIESLKPRFSIRYIFENSKVSSLVSLYVISVQTEEDFVKYIRRKGGKLWTKKQIEENLKKGVFSDYFEEEYPYLASTVLQAVS